MRFQYPAMLILVVIIPIAAFCWTFLRARREKALRRLTMKIPSSGAVGLQIVLVSLGLALSLFAAARPQWGHSWEHFISRSRNIVVAIDVSRSMLAEDVHPNRLARVKADVADLLDSFGSSNRCALVAFRRTGVAISPLTYDHAFLRTALESLTPESAPQGETDLGSAIRECLNILDPAKDEHNEIILISDGGDLRGDALESARIAKERGIAIYTVGIGDPIRGSTIPLAGGGVQMHEGKPVVVKLEEDTLMAISKESGGAYVPLATLSTAETTLGAIYSRFLRKVEMEERNEKELRLAERYQIFLVPGLALLIAGAALSKGRFASLKASEIKQKT